jgi:hypothetical protein
VPARTCRPSRDAETVVPLLQPTLGAPNLTVYVAVTIIVRVTIVARRNPWLISRGSCSIGVTMAVTAAQLPVDST